MDPSAVTVLVTGGGGYIGSHACVHLLSRGYNVIVVDNFVNCYKQEHLSQPESLIRAQTIAGRKLDFYNVSLDNTEELENVFKTNKKIDVVIHFAALKAVGESCAKPLSYYKNNVGGTISLLEVMEKYGCRKIIYSSSATVYGNPETLPISEKELTEASRCSNPYGKTKTMTEEIMKDLCESIGQKSKYRNLQSEVEAVLCSVVDAIITGTVPNDTERKNEEIFLNGIFKWLIRTRQKNPLKESMVGGTNITCIEGKTTFMNETILKDLARNSKEWRVISLRYFNPVGAHESGLLGEDPNGIPNNLMPYITKVAAGKLPKLTVYGNDYNTIDGTGVRDYIHITDLIEGHIKALEKILTQYSGFRAYNLGTGKGHSVLEVVKTFKEATKINIPFEFAGRREGDVAESYCDASLAMKELGWIATKSLHDMCRDAWNFQSNNPDGYSTPC